MRTRGGRHDTPMYRERCRRHGDFRRYSNKSPVIRGVVAQRQTGAGGAEQQSMPGESIQYTFCSF